MPELLAMRTLKHHWALLPVVGICGAACVMCAGYVGYMCATKNDISFKPRSWNEISAPYQAVKAEWVNKFIRHQHTHGVNPELEALRRELGSYKS